ncbi:MAG: hypothetical protein QME77_11785 [bacterium]|nr:hypothetical protein [bacterium]
MSVTAAIAVTLLSGVDGDPSAPYTYTTSPAGWAILAGWWVFRR